MDKKKLDNNRNLSTPQPARNKDGCWHNYLLYRAGLVDGSSQTQSTYGTEVFQVLCLHWYYIHTHLAIMAVCTFCDSLGTKVSFSKSYSPNDKSSLCFGELYKVTYWRTTNPHVEHNSICSFCPPDRSVCTEGHQGFDAGIYNIQKVYQRERKGRERWREREKSTNKQKKKNPQTKPSVIPLFQAFLSINSIP